MCGKLLSGKSIYMSLLMTALFSVHVLCLKLVYCSCRITSFLVSVSVHCHECLELVYHLIVEYYVPLHPSYPVYRVLILYF